MARYLITGGAGFIGSHLAAELLRQEHVVVVLDNLSTGNEHHIKPFMGNKNFTFVKGDILDEKILKKTMQHIDFVLHHAAIASVQESIANPERCSEVNIQGTVKVLLAAKEAGVKKVVYASSAAVYGDDNNDAVNKHNNNATNNTEKEKKESQHPNPLSPYAVTKLAGEYYCKIFSEVYGLPTIVLRYFNVFGEGQNPESEYAAVIPKFIKTILHGKQPTIYGEGMQTRDFIHVHNVVEANILACKATAIKFGIYNIASGEAISILDLVNEINTLTGKNSKPVFAEQKEGDIQHSCASISHAKKDLHYHVKIPFPEGLKRTITYFNHHKKSEEHENGV